MCIFAPFIARSSFSNKETVSKWKFNLKTK